MTAGNAPKARDHHAASYATVVGLPDAVKGEVPVAASPHYRCMEAPCMPKLTEIMTYDKVMRSFS